MGAPARCTECPVNPAVRGYDVVMQTESKTDLTTEPRGAGLGGFGEAGTIEPGVEDESRERDDKTPTAPSDPTDEPAPNGPLNPA